jgi:uncharacterized protein YdhG (YjbR/CyaY superfamily)
MVKKIKSQIELIDDYISAQEPHAKKALRQIRKIVKKNFPNAEEVFSYKMPAYKLNGMLIWYGAAKNHYAIYAVPKVIVAFKERLKKYELRKGTIQFPYEEPVPVKLITAIIKFKAKQNLESALSKSSAKKKTKK